MQVRYAVWKDELSIDKSRLFDIEYNIDLGLRILKQYRDLSGGSIRRALFLYNNGYLYNNTGYYAKVNSSIYNQEPEGTALAASATDPAFSPLRSERKRSLRSLKNSR